MKRFALIGAVGYISLRNVKAFEDTGNDIVAALDPNDSVGLIESNFSKTHLFNEFERFNRHNEKLRRSDECQIGDAAAREVLSLPMHAYLDLASQEKIVASLSSAVAR